MTFNLAIRPTILLLASQKLGSWYQITIRAQIHVHVLSALYSIFSGLSLGLFEITYQIAKIFKL
jgi:uncharacterized membrane protein